MFKFDFALKDNKISDKSNINECNPHGDDNLEWIAAAEISPEKNKESIKIPEKWGLLNVNGYKLFHILPCEISSFLQVNSDISSTDIIPAKYEGGLKIWDCAHRLINFLTNDSGNYNAQFKNKVVLDLGCGHGLLGITALILGAASVHFQDYNEEVIKFATIPSVLKNAEQLNDAKQCKFYSGDWLSFSELIKDRYDIILTSATIYNTGNYKKLLSVFKNGLKQDGIIFVAAKTYYFGNGGGTRQFEEALEKDGNFCSEVLWTSDDGVQQEILKITYRDEEL